MHDYWMALLASAFGIAVALKGPSISYRQHGSNTIGAGGKLSLAERTRRIFADPELMNWLPQGGSSGCGFQETFSESTYALTVRCPERHGWYSPGPSVFTSTNSYASRDHANRSAKPDTIRPAAFLRKSKFLTCSYYMRLGLHAEKGSQTLLR